jgi:GDP/UDP-N,N'-diacetylbacillosamine 2-epimerase (hydrolysing)
MGRPRIKIGVLTSSRADYGIYLPLLKKLEDDKEIEMSLIVFGTHLKKHFGFTVRQIEMDGFRIDERIDCLRYGDKPEEIALNYAHTGTLFAKYWAKSSFDIVLCLGDRFEMAAAVNAGVPFGISFAHLHAGETSEGAIDNIYRDQISLASELHFVSINVLQNRIENLTGKTKSTFYSGAISLENLKSIPLLSIEEFKIKWNIDFSSPTILMTVHPETVDVQSNIEYVHQLKSAIIELSETTHILVTMPNADTLGSLYREMFKGLRDKYPERINIIENLGTQSYFSAMKHCALLLGNTSSGIIEAATFKKHVLNIGDRQKGRIAGDNVVHVPFNHEVILKETKKYFGRTYNGINIYECKNGTRHIIQGLKNKINGI